MMNIRTVLLPPLLTLDDIHGRAVVVFDVLRATTTITNALANGAKEVRVFDSIDAARTGAMQFHGAKLLAGEHRCLPPEGFDLGNSPVDFTRERVESKTIFMTTTNGTRALLAARNADRLFAGAIVNAHSIATVLKTLDLPVTLLCSGTQGEIAFEDALGAGCVIDQLSEETPVMNDSSAMCYWLYARQKHYMKAPECSLRHVLGATQGGKNILAAHLPQDIEFASQLSSLSCIPECDTATMTLRAFARL